MIDPMTKTESYIERNWENCIKEHTEEVQNAPDDGLEILGCLSAL